uniref:adenosine kinase n=1 Tax=Timema douglasi TaxID=61478 RepID=A0A7R8VKL4_TIMDO|nr:unnamed protein product [Timema douglasi]
MLRGGRSDDPNPMVVAKVVDLTTQAPWMSLFFVTDGAEFPPSTLSAVERACTLKLHEVYLNAGGSAQNTARIFQWLVGPQHCCVYFGSIGSDEEGTLVETLLRRSGVHTRYTSHRNLPTGRCLALVHGEHRSLVANIGAARIYAPHHLNTQDNLKVLSQVKIIYIEGFFIANNFLTAKELIHFCQAKSIILAFNLSSAYICKENPNQVKELLKSADIIFGNEDEYKTLSDTLELGLTGLRDIVEIVRDLNHLHPHIIVLFPPFLLGERGLVEDAATACWRLAHASASLGTYDILTPPYALRGVSTTTRHVALRCRLARASRPIPSTFIVTIATISVVPRATRVASTAGESPLTLGTARCYFLSFHYTFFFLHFLTLEPYTKLSLPLPLPAGGGGGGAVNSGMDAAWPQAMSVQLLGGCQESRLRLRSARCRGSRLLSRAWRSLSRSGLVPWISVATAALLPCSDKSLSRFLSSSTRSNPLLEGVPGRLDPRAKARRPIFGERTRGGLRGKLWFLEYLPQCSWPGGEEGADEEAGEAGMVRRERPGEGGGVLEPASEGGLLLAARCRGPTLVDADGFATRVAVFREHGVEAVQAVGMSIPHDVALSAQLAVALEAGKVLHVPRTTLRLRALVRQDYLQSHGQSTLILCACLRFFQCRPGYVKAVASQSLQGGFGAQLIQHQSPQRNPLSLTDLSCQLRKEDERRTSELGSSLNHVSGPDRAQESISCGLFLGVLMIDQVRCRTDSTASPDGLAIGLHFESTASPAGLAIGLHFESTVSPAGLAIGLHFESTASPAGLALLV